MFGRKIELSFDGPDLNVPVIDELRVAFDVKKSTGGISQGNIIIYNLNETNRKALVTSKLILKPESSVNTVSLIAGYEDDAQQLAYGDILSVKNYRVGPDWITEIEYYTAYSKIQLSQTSVSYSLPTLSKYIVDQIFESMSINVLYSSDALDVILNKKLFSYNASGSSFKTAKELLRAYGLEVSFIHNDSVLVTVINKGHGDAATTISVENGLIGTPAITDAGTIVQSLLSPLLEIKEKIKLKSFSVYASLPEGYSNDFFITSLNHVGDTHGDDWYTEIEAYYADIEDLNLIP